MSQQNPIRLFVTHNWHDSDDYSRLFEYLESANNFFYRNTSTPDKPPSGDTEAIREDLRKQIRAAEVLIAFTGLHDEQPDLTIFQMNFAQAEKKSVVLMKPFGSKKPISKLLTDRADDVVDWEARGLVDTIKRLARGENTARYDVVEFNPDDFKDFKT
jgi:hypothetical protein